MRSRWFLLGFVWCVLVAPTPGAVGSCDEGDKNEPVEFSYYCRNREELACVRRFLRKEITERERDQCRWDAVDRCRRREFPSDCHPSTRAAEACLNALRSFDTLETKEKDLPECDSDALCRATPSEEPDGGGLAE
ncbi:MAG TPA: hypothetical protein VJR89_07950 [Polyangiales bacterium]|nr:hypothetical protein [Polyangiales bacterium]